MSAERYRVDDLSVDVETGAVVRGDHRLQLSPLSFALLVALLRSAPEVAKRQDLMDEVWDGAVVSDETLSQRVRLLREALGDDAGTSHYVESVRGWGYRLALPAEREGGPHSSIMVAVLPFSNIGGCAEDEPLCEGLAEEIIGALAGVDGLRVIARTSSFALARAGLDVCALGERLGAGSIVEGSVRRAGKRIRVTVQLVETTAGGHLWSENYDRELRDVLDLEAEIAEAVTRRLRKDLTAGGLVRRRRAVDPEAYQAYLEGRHHFHSGGGPEAMARAGACLERAAALDSSFAPTFDALAELHWYLGFFGGMRPRDAFGQSTWFALRALELDETLADTHALLAMLRKELDYNWPEVERELERARELDPHSPAVRLRRAVSGLLPHGRLEEALAEIDEALVSDPSSLFVRWWSGTVAYLARRPDRVMEEGHRMITFEPSNPMGSLVLGMGEELRGNFADAVTHHERAYRQSGRMPFVLAFLALAQGRAGLRDEVRSSLAYLRDAAASSYAPPFASAMAHVGLGEWDSALAFMEAAVEERDPLIMPIKSFHFLDPMRDDPRFLSVLRTMNL